MNKEICRFCGSYQPDERYKGVIGICFVDGFPQSMTDSCMHFEPGEQKWLCGEKVIEQEEGRWITMEDDIKYECSHCGKTVIYGKVWKHCPECGKKMENGGEPILR